MSDDSAFSLETLEEVFKADVFNSAHPQTTIMMHSRTYQDMVVTMPPDEPRPFNLLWGFPIGIHDFIGLAPTPTLEDLTEAVWGWRDELPHAETSRVVDRKIKQAWWWMRSCANDTWEVLTQNND